MLELDKINDVVEVWVNGERVGERGWYPFSFDITSFLKEGENQLELRITNTPANSHVLRLQQYRFGEKWGKVVPSGLLEKVKVIVSENFNVVFEK